MVGYLGDEVRLLPDHRDLVLELGRVVGADLGAEPVLERGDDPAAVGVVLRVGAGDDEHVERQPQHVAADLDVPLLHHVEHRDLDPLGQVGQLVDRDDAAVGPRDQPEVDGVRVAQRAALGDLHRVHVADQVGDAGVGRGELLGVPLVAVPPLDRQRVAELDRAAARLVGDRLVGVLAELGAADDRRPLVEQADQGAQQPGLALAALAEEHHVVAGDQRPLELRDDGVLEAVQPGPRVAALAQGVEQVVAELGAQRLLDVAGGAQLAERCQRWAESWEQKSRLHATQRHNNWTASPVCRPGRYAVAVGSGAHQRGQRAHHVGRQRQPVRRWPGPRPATDRRPASRRPAGRRHLDRRRRGRRPRSPAPPGEVKTGTYWVPSCSITGSAMAPSGGGSAPAGHLLREEGRARGQLLQHRLGLGLARRSSGRSRSFLSVVSGHSSPGDQPRASGNGVGVLCPGVLTSTARAAPDSAYDACCGRLHRRQAEAETAEELMRSRYAAYAVGELDHVFRTWHPRTRPGSIEPDPALTWTGLTVLDVVDGGPGDETGEVEFEATYDRGGTPGPAARAQPVRAPPRAVGLRGRGRQLGADAPAMLTSQLTPNLSLTWPNSSPHSASRAGRRRCRRRTSLSK